METGNTSPARRRSFRSMVLFTCSAYPEMHRSMQSDGLGINISDTGLGMYVRQPLVEGEILKLRFPANATILTGPVYAEVVWVRQEKDRFRTGLKFVA
jgi:PilZ domain-containing protein